MKREEHFLTIFTNGSVLFMFLTFKGRRKCRLLRWLLEAVGELAEALHWLCSRKELPFMLLLERSQKRRHACTPKAQGHLKAW
ncbi:hypothetical protein RLEG12_09315 (plasmid) [Rhizobium leguminosarum bv. trifolii CB782]|nr:hypothetical protein RLEG12_09315 [Rhizobium leguminosarum bv. trifolii CB782]